MAFCRTGGLILKSIKPVLSNPCFVIPSSVNLQVRHAARKGYREKVKRKKLAAVAAAPPAIVKEISRIKKKYAKIEKTVDLKKPEPPPDDVFIPELFNYKKYTLSEAVTFHREYHHPEVYNNPNVPVSVRIEINMVGKKITQFLKPFSGIASIPHPFVISQKREVLVFCNPEDTDLALSSGASIAGGLEIIKKLQEGIIQPSLFDFVIAHTSFLPNLTPVRNMLKDQMPRANRGTLTNDLKSAINRFLHGIDYKCVQIGTAQDFGFIDCDIGTIDMELEHLEENLKALIADIETNRPPRDGKFISWIWCLCRPSDEEFSVDLSKYVNEKFGDVDDDDEEEEVSERRLEAVARQKLMEEYKEKTLMGNET